MIILICILYFPFPVCHLDLESGESESSHYLVQHKCEMVWNRNDRLKLITTDTNVRSKILTGAQKPTRLANGAIAKGIGGVGGPLSATPFSSSSPANIMVDHSVMGSSENRGNNLGKEMTDLHIMSLNKSGGKWGQNPDPLKIQPYALQDTSLAPKATEALSWKSELVSNAFPKNNSGTCNDATFTNRNKASAASGTVPSGNDKQSKGIKALTLILISGI